MAVIVIWSDWGGYYDAVAPPFLSHDIGLGFRVPMLVISPCAKILKFIEESWHPEAWGRPIGERQVSPTSSTSERRV
jgi:phospholipase C